jgi:hypothetical protein
LPSRAFDWPGYLSHSFEVVRNNLHTITRIQSYKFAAFHSAYAYGDDRSISPRNHLHSAYICGVIDPRDKIFALRNLCLKSHYPDWAPTADYTVLWEVLYTHVALQTLENGWIDTISQASRARQPPNSILPSWVPEYRLRDPEQAASLRDLPGHSEWRAGGAGGGSASVPVHGLAARTSRLTKKHRRKIDQSHMSGELLRSGNSGKHVLQSFIGLRCLMKDEIVYVGQIVYDLSDRERHRSPSSRIWISSRGMLNTSRPCRVQHI